MAPTKGDYGTMNNKSEISNDYREGQLITVIVGNPICAVSRSYRLFPAKQVLEFSGWLSKFEPNEMTESSVPICNFTMTTNEGL